MKRPVAIASANFERRLTAGGAESAAAINVIDYLPIGVFVIDREARPLVFNRAADEILAAGDGLVIRRGRLRACEGPESARLTRLISQAAETAPEQGCFSGGAVALPRGAARRALTAVVAPLRGARTGSGARLPAAVVFVSDPDRGHPVQEWLLGESYRLTPTEAALVLQLMRGEGLTTAAKRLQITVNTAKTHLQHVFEKTGTHHQAELVGLILSGPAGLRFD